MTMSKSFKREYVFDEIFHDHETPFHVGKPRKTRIKIACATALTAWATCMSGGKPPDDFGRGLVALRDITGFTMTCKNIETELDKMGI